MFVQCIFNVSGNSVRGKEEDKTHLLDEAVWELCSAIRAQ